MEKILLIDKGIVFTRIAVVCENKLQQFYIYNNIEKDLTNTIVQGRIKDIVKNLQAAFVDYGQDKPGFLHFKHIPECYKARLNQGVRIPVQIIRENVGEKGHKLTGLVNLSGKNVVCLPFEEGIAVSRKIKDKETRERLKKVVSQISEDKYGFIVRTGATKIKEEALQKEVLDLVMEADALIQKAQVVEKGIILGQDMPMELKVVQELLKEEEQLRVATNDQDVTDTLAKQHGESVLIKTFPTEENLINLYGLLKQYEELFKKKVWLKSGGNIMIEHTEAMTVIDVNSAKAVIKKNREKAIKELNKQAIKESLYQIINRNISGIIVIDLVEMRKSEDQLEIYNYAKELVVQLGDSRSKVYPLTELGLLQIARTKNYISLAQHVYSGCERCGAPASAFNMPYLAYRIELQIRQLAATSSQQKVYIKALPQLMQYLKTIDLIKKLNQRYGIEVEVLNETNKDGQMFSITYHI